MQWLRSEQQKKSVIPHAFWYFSIGGGIILLTYAIYRQDIVFMIGQASGLFIYLRNIQLIRKESGRLRIAEPASSDNNAVPASSVRKVS